MTGVSVATQQRHQSAGAKREKRRFEAGKSTPNTNPASIAIAMADHTRRASGQTNGGVDAPVGTVVKTMPARREPRAIHW
jgi:hypothetical protein